MLQVGVAWEHDAEVALCAVHEGAAQLDVAAHELRGEVLREQADVSRHLVVPAAARVQAGAGLADLRREARLDGHVDVLVVHVPGEGAVGDLLRYVRQAAVDRLLVGVGDDALPGQHPGVRPRARNVLLRHVLVDLERGAELLRELVDALLEPAAPKCHVIPHPVAPRAGARTSPL